MKNNVDALLERSSSFKRYDEVLPPYRGVFVADFVGFDSLVSHRDDLIPLEISEFKEKNKKIMEILAVSLSRMAEIRTFTSSKIVRKKLLRAKKEAMLGLFKCCFVRKKSKNGQDYYDLE